MLLLLYKRYIAIFASFLGTSHNLSWRGGGGGEIGGPSIFFGWNMGGLKMPKDDLGARGGSSSFL